MCYAGAAKTHVRLHSSECPGQRESSSYLKGKGRKTPEYSFTARDLGGFNVPLLRGQQSVTERHRGPLVNL